MSGEGHWKAEDYEWDPHRLRAEPRSRADRERQPPGEPAFRKSPDAGSEATHDTAEQGLEEAGGLVAPGVLPVPAATSAEEGSREGNSGGTPSAGEPSGGEGQASKAAELPTRDLPPVVRDTLAAVHGPSKKRIPLQCQVDGCQKDLSKEKEYYQRYRICEDHLKLGSLIKDGIEQRFCQQCGRFHVLADFDADKRSCRARLNLHNDRRRKRVPEQNTPRQDLYNPQPRTRRTRTRRKRVPYGEQAASEELEALEAEAVAVDSGLKHYEQRATRVLEAPGDELGAEEDYPVGRAADFRSLQSALGFSTAYRGYPMEVNAALQGLQRLLPPLSTGLPGALTDERYHHLGSPMQSVTFSQQPQRAEPGSPMSMHYAAHLASEADIQAERAWLARQQAQQQAQEQAGQQRESAQERGRTRTSVLQGERQSGQLYKSASDPVYGPIESGGASSAVQWAASGTAENRGGQRSVSDGSGSPSAYKPSLRFRTRPVQDFWYDQQAHLLRDSSWGSRDESQRQQLQQAAVDLDYSAFSMPGTQSQSQRTASASPTIATGPLQPGLSILAPRLASGEGSLLGRFSERGSNISQLLSGGSESSTYHGLSAQESAGSRHGGHMPSRFSVSEAAASLKRINSGATRLERMPSGQHRLVATSNPTPQQESLFAMGSSRRSTGDLPRMQPRSSDPGSWAQQYPGFYGEGRRSEPHVHSRPGRYSDPGSWVQYYYGFHGKRGPIFPDPERLQINRSGMKLDIPPAGLPQSMREDYLRMLGAQDAAHLEAAMRPGCTHLVATCLSQATSSNALEAAKRMVGCGKLWGRAEMLIQVLGSAAHMQDGQLKGYWAGEDHLVLQPARPTPWACAVTGGGTLSVGIAAGQGCEPSHLLARCNGAFLVDEQVDGASEMQLHIPEGSGEGVLWLEADSDGILSEPAPVVLTASIDAAEEVQRLRTAVCSRTMSVADMENLVVDIGMSLQYAQHLTASSPASSPADPRADAEPQMQPALSSGRGHAPPGCCGLLPLSWGNSAEAGPMSDSAYVQYVTSAARRVVAFCFREGWPALAARILPAAAVGLKNWPELVVALEEYLGKGLLLHAAVSSGSLSTVILLLDLYQLCQLECPVGGSLEGATALHVAAGLQDGGVLAKLLQARCSSAQLLWNSARDSQGRAPADIAYIANRRQSAHARSSAAMAGLRMMDTAAPVTPPATPRLGDLPTTAPLTSRHPARLQQPPPHWLQLAGSHSMTTAEQEAPHRQQKDERHPMSEARPNVDSLPVSTPFSDSGPMLFAVEDEQTFTPSLTLRHSWPCKSDKLPSTTSGPGPTSSSSGDPSEVKEHNKLLTWPPITKVELTAKLRLHQEAGTPMVVDVRADAVAPGGPLLPDSTS